MDEKQKPTIFRKETLERVSSPEQLSDYLRVTNPGIWIVLAAVVVKYLSVGGVLNGTSFNLSDARRQSNDNFRMTENTRMGCVSDKSFKHGSGDVKVGYNTVFHWANGNY